jgi:putative oxygen-independent coproporphyrinogen III oxidase
MVSLYIHIPFCLSKCHYCDFYSLGWGRAPIPEDKYCRALRQEWQRRQQALTSSALAKIPTVFFGGGTPSLFSPEAIGKILRTVTEEESAVESAVTEVTLELNPKTADRKKLEGFKQVGINRVSMGLQSLDDQILEKLGRAHSAQEALESLTLALEAGLEGVNVDIMYGLPYQDLKKITDTLVRLTKFPLTHLSAYELILEEHTPFYDLYRYDQRPLPDSDLILQMRSAIDQFAEQKGMSLYEISNWANPGQECRHNLRYWDYESFLGLGAGAVSFLQWEELGSDLQARGENSNGEIPYGLRWTNPHDLRKYLEQPGDLPNESLEWISRDTAQAEFMMMGLRKAEGIRYRDFEKKFQISFPENFQQALEKSQRKGWVSLHDDGVQLTDLGRQFSNEILQEFL